METKAEKMLTVIFSEYIRKRALARVGGCERCRNPKYDTTREDGTTRPAYMQLQASHFYGRGNKCVKWDEDNAVGLCGGCHTHFHGHPREFDHWFQNHVGEITYNWLLGRLRRRARPDVAMLMLYFRHKIRELDDNPR